MAKKEVLNNDALTVRVNAEPVLDAIEDGLEAIEDGVDRIVTVTRNNPFLIAGALVVGLGLGGFVAYKIAVKRTSLKYEEILEEEIAAAKEFYMRLAKDGVYSTPEGAAGVLVPEEAVSALQNYQGREAPVAYDKVEAQPDVVVEEANVQINVFESRNPPAEEWDYDREVLARAENPDSPYVIHHEEHEENPEGHDQVTFTYYAGDNILADEKDQPIDNTDYVVGDDNLTRFGHGSGDPRVVYIRNEKIDTDFEVLHSEGTYRQEVLGLADREDSTLQHSRRHPNRPDRTTQRRMRVRDE